MSSREAPVAVAMEAVPIARVVFVARLPALDKESEAGLAASVLLPSQDWMLSRSGLRGRGHGLPDEPLCLRVMLGVQ